jgi:hypothetical protein
MLQETNSAQERWTERDVAPRTAPTRSVFPDDALAVIYKPARSAMTSGKARTRDWKLRFEPRSRPLIEPLMGWTACDDTLSQIELTFPSAAAAVAYARRQGLRYLLQGADDPVTRPGSNAKVANTNSSSPDIRSSDVWPSTGMGRTDARAEGRSKQVGTGTRPCRVLRESPGRA